MNPSHHTSKFTPPAYLTGAPHAWCAGSLDRQALESQARQMMLGTAFEAQRKRFAAQMLDTYCQERALDRLMRDQGRFAMFTFSVYLHHHAAQTGGVSCSRLLALFAHGRHMQAGVMASPTRIKALLMLWRLSGYLSLAPASLQSDQRSKLLQPTDKLMQAGHRWLRGFLISIEGSLPLAMPVHALMATPGLLQEVLSNSVLAYLHDRFTLHESFPSVRRFMQRDGGYLVLMNLIHTMQCNEATGRWHASAPPHALSKCFRVSRGTVRNALEEAVDQGWLALQTTGGHDWLMSDGFVQQCRRWAAYEMVWMAGNVNAAYTHLRSLDGSRAVPSERQICPESRQRCIASGCEHTRGVL